MPTPEDSGRISRTRLGFFDSLTPTTYLLAAVMLATLIGGGILLFILPGYFADVETPQPPQESTAPPIQESSISSPAEQPEAVRDVPSPGQANASAVVEPPNVDRESSGGAVQGKPAEKEKGNATVAIPEPMKAPAVAPVVPKFVPAVAQKQVVSPSTPKPAAGNVPPAQAAKAAPAPDKVQAKPGWIVQISANKDPQLAADWARKINGLGTGAKAYVVEKGTVKGTFHLLRLGPFSTEEKARQAASEVASKTGLKEGTVLPVAP